MLTNGYPSAVFLQFHRYYAITFSWIKYSYSLFLSCTTLLRRKSLHVSTLPCSDNLIFTYAFRCLLWACVLDDACNIIGNFINASFTLPHTRRIFATTTFLLYSWFRPVHSEIRQWIRFSTYSPWAFYRPPAYRWHHPPLDRFRDMLSQSHTATLCRLYRASDLSAFAYICQPEYQGRRFRALPHHSTYWITSSPNVELFVLLLVPNLFS